MAAPFGSYPYDAAGIDNFAHPLFINAMRPPTTQDIYNPGTQWMDGSASPKVIYETIGGGVWPPVGGVGVFTSLTVTGTTNINTSGAAATNIGTGGTGAVNIGNVTGNTAVTGNLTATGSITAGTTLTATLGNITATNGNIVRGTAGNKDVYTSVATTIAAGANSAGTVTLVAGEAVVATTAITASSQVRLYRQGVGATGAAALGIVTLLTRSAGVSFTIRAVQPADATAAQASDVSIIAWEIVN